MGLSALKYIFCLTIVLACGYANAGSIAKREADDDKSTLSRYIDSLEQIIGKLPFVGERLDRLMKWTVQAISLFEIGTNGALARLLGGALPCKVTLEGTTCTGLTNNGGFGALLMKTINGIPGPDLGKSMINLAIEMLMDPTMDLLFGGVTVQN